MGRAKSVLVRNMIWALYVVVMDGRNDPAEITTGTADVPTSVSHVELDDAENRTEERTPTIDKRARKV